MAEVHRPPSTEDEGDILAQRSGQQVIGNAYSGRTPVMSSAPRGDTLFSGPETYPAQMRVLDGIPLEEVECLEPLSISVPDAPLDSRPMAGNIMRNSPDVAIYEKDTTGRPMEGVTSPTPWRRSVTLLHLDSQPSRYKSMPDRSKDPISEDIPQRQEKPLDSKTVSCRNTDKAVRRAPSGLTKDPLSVSHSEPLVWNPVSDAMTENKKSEERSLSESLEQSRQNLAGSEQLEYTESRPDSGEAIVVGAIGSAAPWFLTGWAHDVEIEFMIDTGCQVTILSATVFQRMCVVKPEVGSALQVCRRRLVSADSSNSTPAWTDCAGLSPELCCWRLQIGNLSVDTDGRLWRKRAPLVEGSQLVVPRRERQAMIHRFHDSLFAGHLGISRTVFRLQTRVYWPGLRDDVRTYIASCTMCIARKSPSPRRAPMGHVVVGRRWERVAMDLLDM